MCSSSCLPHIIEPSLLELLLYHIPQYEQDSEIIHVLLLTSLILKHKIHLKNV